MAQYINKDALVAEINRLIAELVEKGEGTMFEQGRISAFEDAKLFLDTLEVKEVDLEVELANYNREHVDENGFFNTEHFAKHFFGLGINAQKGE